MSDFPQMGEKLFKDGGHLQEYAHFAWGGKDS